MEPSKRKAVAQIYSNKLSDVKLRAQFNQLLNNAHDNQYKLKRFEAIEFKLMAAESIAQLLSILRDEYVQLFKLDACTLLLEDEDLSLRRLIPESLYENQQQQFLSLLNFPLELQKLHYLPAKITTGVYQKKRHQWLMADDNIRSIAVMPLIRRGKKIGVFCCASYQQTRFKADEACDFLQRLSVIMAVCIENALNMERLRLSSMTDTLTQVRNRRFFDERLPEELARHDRSLNAISCLFLDIDHFKSVNDSHGHGVGDDVLRQVAQRIESVLRSQDILARYGGEEFAVLLPDTGNDEAMMVAQRIINAVNKYRIVIDKQVILTITISAGVATLMTDNTIGDVEQLGNRLLATADQALYDAKEQGRNRAINAGLLALAKNIKYGHNNQA